MSNSLKYYKRHKLNNHPPPLKCQNCIQSWVVFYYINWSRIFFLFIFDSFSSPCIFTPLSLIKLILAKFHNSVLKCIPTCSYALSLLSLNYRTNLKLTPQYCKIFDPCPTHSVLHNPAGDVISEISSSNLMTMVIKLLHHNI